MRSFIYSKVLTYLLVQKLVEKLSQSLPRCVGVDSGFISSVSFLAEAMAGRLCVESKWLDVNAWRAGSGTYIPVHI